MESKSASTEGQRSQDQPREFLAEWAAKELWTLFEAAQLLIPVPPCNELITAPKQVRDYLDTEEQRDLFVKRYEALKSATSLYKANAQHPKGLACIDPVPLGGVEYIGRRRVEPSPMITWARRKTIPIPPELEAAFPVIVDVATLTSGPHVSEKLAILNRAAKKFWENADRNDPGTHPENAKVAAWLMEKGMSKTLADKAATIIRPEWAPTGRKPEK